ncbi:hypothetical protein CFAM422_009912 [Trichoderma lentiforme]|uniref:Uncharacterized protein n=1 Tax=Trichoderma lentiforme TaxID=1567552 RepID=A0A9P4X6Q2_9HYPO|nr:hypothetical protein CFAM422_009912 [Trichoderma lentiforme]
MSARNSQNGTDDDAAVSPVRLLPHDNPCPNPQLPPLMIEVDNPYVPQPGGRDQYLYDAVIDAYQEQATNMTQLDQNEYLSLIEASYFKMDHDTKRGPSHHPLYSKLQNEPTWAKFVFLSALCPEISFIRGQPTPFQLQMISAFKSIEIEGYLRGYLSYRPNARRCYEHQDKVLSLPPSGPHPDLLDAISTMQNAIMNLNEKSDAIREEMRQQGEESKQKFKTGIERILQLYS